MKARVGDRLIRDGGDGHRVCEIIGLHHADGSPPYVVRWLSDGHIALLYPGPYMRLSHRRAGRQPDSGAGEPGTGQAAAATRDDGGKGKNRGKAKAARPALAGRRWTGNPFLPRPMATPWPSRGTT